MNIITFEPILKGLEVKSCVYRLNRDIRFSNDKSPYKSHLGAFIVRGGKRTGTDSQVIISMLNPVTKA